MRTLIHLAIAVLVATVVDGFLKNANAEGARQQKVESSAVPPPPKSKQLDPVSTSSSSPKMAALAARLHDMALKDQEVRTADAVSAERMEEVDKKNHRELLRVYEKYGWPTFSMIGKQAAQDYWLLVQHQDLDFQKMVLPAMEHAVSKMEASKINYAYLYDRVMVGEGKPQHWGTQGKCEEGKATLQAVDDPTHLEQRRNELGIYPVSVEKYLTLLAPQCVNTKQDISSTPQAH